MVLVVNLPRCSRLWCCPGMYSAADLEGEAFWAGPGLDLTYGPIPTIREDFRDVCSDSVGGRLMRAEPEHRGILALDIQGFGRLDRGNPARVRMRSGLHRILQNALRAAGIHPERA